MEISFDKFSNEDQIQQALENQLPLEKSAISVIKVFLEKQGLKCSSIHDVEEDPLKKPINPNIDRKTTRQFNRYIVCKIPMSLNRSDHSAQQRVRSWINSILFKSEYRIEFHFWNDLLVEIIVAQEVTGF